MLKQNIAIKNASLIFSVPADGVKGKTWGPSSGGYVLNSMASTGSTTSQISSKSRPGNIFFIFRKQIFSNFSWMFLYPNKFFQGMFFIFRKQIFYFQIFLGIPEDRWSKSNTSLEKSPFSKPGLHTVTSVPEIGKIFF